MSMELTKTIQIPIYGTELLICISDDATTSRMKRNNIYGPYEGKKKSAGALCSWSGGHRFGLFFCKDHLDSDIVAHEVFHLTMRTLERHSTYFSEATHEVFATLHGYLYSEVSLTLAELQLKAGSKKKACK